MIPVKTLGIHLTIPQHMRTLFFLLVTFFTAHGAQAQNESDPPAITLPHTTSFACMTSPELLVSWNPGLNLPNCDDRTTDPRVVPSHMPVAAIFISTPNYLGAGFSIAESFIQNPTGATLNILDSTSRVDAHKDKIEYLLALAKQHNVPVNYITVEAGHRNQIPQFLRDVGIFRASPNHLEYVSAPYFNEGQAVTTFQDMLEQCGIAAKTPYFGLENFKTAYEEAYAHRKDDTNSPATLSPKVLEAEAGLEAVLKTWPQGISKDMAGNYMSLPGGTIAVGFSREHLPDPDLLQYFRETQHVVEVEIPVLRIGHIDEIFNIVPARNDWGFALLRASPREMITFLKSRPGDEVVYDAQDPDAINAQDSTTVQEHIDVWRTLIEDLKQAHTQPHPAFIAILKRLEMHKALLITTRYTVARLLEDSEFVALMGEQDSLIRRSTSILVGEMQKTLGTESPLQIIDIPVLWGKYDKKPIIPNPVNGLAVNGKYFLSKLNRPVKSQWGFHKDLSFRPGGTLEEYHAYKKVVLEKLNSIFTEPPVFVDTRLLDRYGGNLHCATTNINVPCK